MRLAWITRLLTASDCNWRTVPYILFRKLWGLNFPLRCNDDTKHLPKLPFFYRNILEFFKELKTIYGYDQESDLVLFNNKEILVDNKAVQPSKWVQIGVILMKDLLKDDGSYLPFRRISDKFACKTNLTTAHWQNPRRGAHWSKKMERQPVLKWRSLGRVFQASDKCMLGNEAKRIPIKVYS